MLRRIYCFFMGCQPCNYLLWDSCWCRRCGATMDIMNFRGEFPVDAYTEVKGTLVEWSFSDDPLPSDS